MFDLDERYADDPAEAETAVALLHECPGCDEVYLSVSPHTCSVCATETRVVDNQG